MTWSASRTIGNGSPVRKRDKTRTWNSCLESIKTGSDLGVSLRSLCRGRLHAFGAAIGGAVFKDRTHQMSGGTAVAQRVSDHGDEVARLPECGTHADPAQPAGVVGLEAPRCHRPVLFGHLDIEPGMGIEI